MEGAPAESKPANQGRARFAVVVVVVAILFYIMVIRGTQFFLVPTGSMIPTLVPGDRIVTQRSASYERGDIVVVPDEAEGGFLVKRVAAVGGDSVGVRDGALYLNGEYASEPYLREPMGYILAPPIVVPEGHLFLLGDNRNESDDSHLRRETWPAETVVGLVVWRYFPWPAFGPVAGYPLRNIQEL